MGQEAGTEGRPEAATTAEGGSGQAPLTHSLTRSVIQAPLSVPTLVQENSTGANISIPREAVGLIIVTIVLQ